MSESWPDNTKIDGGRDDDPSTSPSPEHDPRPWVGIRFECCGAYARVYRNPEATAYVGRCPRCLQTVTLRVGPGGTDQRFFVAR